MDLDGSFEIIARLWFYPRGSFRSPNAPGISYKCGLKSKAATAQSKELGKLFLRIRLCLELFRTLIIVKPSCKFGIYKDAWLPSPEGKISSSVLHLSPESTVDSLIDPATGWWNINLIDWCFHPPDARLIKSLPLSSIPQLDTLVWSFEKLGSYSVKSGYKLLCELHNLDMNRPQVSESQKGFWKSLWKMKVPGAPRLLILSRRFSKKSEPNLLQYRYPQQRLGQSGTRETKLASKIILCPSAM
nr:hypothetical protein CFP56_23406 [Quercus suber]